MTALCGGRALPALDATSEGLKAYVSAQKLFKAGAYEKAEILCSNSIDLFVQGSGSEGPARPLLAQIHMRQGYYAEAQEDFAKCSLKDGYVASSCAVAAQRAGHLDAAKRVLAMYFVRRADYLEDRFGIGVSLQKQQKDNLEFVALVLRAVETKRDPAEVIEDLETAEKLLPKQEITAYLLGNAFLETRDFKKADHYLKMAGSTPDGKLRGLVQGSLKQLSAAKKRPAQG